MEYCRTKDTRRYAVHLLAIFTVAACALLVYIRPMFNYGLVWLGIVCVAAIIFPVFGMILDALWCHRSYNADSRGITVAYGPMKPVFHPWTSISEVGICVMHFNTRTKPDTMVRIVVGPEFCGPSKGYGVWATLSYSQKNHNRIILIDYSEAVLAKIQAVCPHRVVDYRNLPQA